MNLEKKDPRQSAQRTPLGQTLIQAGLLTPAQLNEALVRQRVRSGRLGSILIQMGFVKEEHVLLCLSNQLRLSHVSFRDVVISESVLGCVPAQTAKKFTIVPVAVQKGRLVLAMCNPTDLEAVKEIEFQLGTGVQPVVATQGSLNQAIDHYYGDSESLGEHGSEPEGTLKPIVDADSLDEEDQALAALDAIFEDKLGVPR